MSGAEHIVRNALTRHKVALEGCAAQYESLIISLAKQMAQALKNGNKLLICGNGGSACDAMHFAGECVGRFVSDRRPLPAIALTADPGIITAIGNDYGFEEIFARQLRAHAKTGDMLIAISTSGQSPNILRALQVAHELGVNNLLLTGERGTHVAAAQHMLAVPSAITAHIQEVHIWILQLFIALIEKELFDINH